MGKSMAEQGGKTALLVIDVQVSMFEPDSYPHEGDQVLANIGSLLDGARSTGTPVIFVRHEHARYEPMMRGNPGWEIHPAIAPRPGETIVDKRACDAFYNTPLEQTLRDLNIGHL